MAHEPQATALSVAWTAQVTQTRLRDTLSSATVPLGRSDILQGSGGFFLVLF